MVRKSSFSQQFPLKSKGRFAPFRAPLLEKEGYIHILGLDPKDPKKVLVKMGNITAKCLLRYPSYKGKSGIFEMLNKIKKVGLPLKVLNKGNEAVLYVSKVGFEETGLSSSRLKEDDVTAWGNYSSIPDNHNISAKEILDTSFGAFRYAFLANQQGEIPVASLDEQCFNRSTLFAYLLSKALYEAGYDAHEAAVVGYIRIDVSDISDDWNFHVAPLIRVDSDEGPKIFVAESSVGYMSITDWADLYLDKLTSPGELVSSEVFRFIPSSMLDVTQDGGLNEAISSTDVEVQALEVEESDTYDVEGFGEEYAKSLDFWNSLYNILSNKNKNFAIQPQWLEEVGGLKKEVFDLLQGKLNDDACDYIEIFFPEGVTPD